MPKTQAPSTPAIVGGISLDETSNLVLARTAELAAGHDAAVHLCFACGDLSTSPEAAERLLEGHEADLQRWAAEHLIGHPLAARCHVHVALGEPADALSSLAEDVGASFIVVGTHERSRFERLIEGSVARTLIDEAPCSVVVAMPRRTSDPRRQARPDEQAEGIDIQPHPPTTATGAIPRRRRVRLRPPQSTVGAGGTPLQV